MVFEAFPGGSIDEILIAKIISVFIVIVASSVAAKVITTAISRFGIRSDMPGNIARYINKGITYFIGFIGFIIILDIFDLNVSNFVASFGIVGLIIGLSSQAIISNFIAGILILLEKPFGRGDIIDVAGFLGIVEDISIRSTRVRTIDGKVITVPNSTFTTTSVINYSKKDKIQVRIPISFSPEVDIKKISEIMGSAAKNTEGVSPDNVEVLATGLVLSGFSKNIGIELRFWIDEIRDKDKISSKINGKIQEEFIKEKIIIVSEINGT